MTRIKRSWRVLGLPVLVLLGVAAFAAAFYWLPGRLVDSGSDRATLSTEELTEFDTRTSLIIEERRNVLAVGAAAIAGATLFYTHRRQRLTEDENRTTRYTQAVEQLGHDDEAVRLGGIYALERLANDSVGDRGTVVEVLSAFVRRDGRDADGARKRAPIDVEAAAQVLGRNRFPHASPDLTGASLAGADLAQANLAGADLAQANLAGADLADANLNSAYLPGADLTHADLTHADLTGVYLTGAADLTGASLFGADLTGASLNDANLTRANLARADLTEANLTTKQYADARGITKEQWRQTQEGRREEGTENDGS